MLISYFLDSVVYYLVQRCLMPLTINSIILLLSKFHPRGEEFSVMKYFIAFHANRKWSNLFDIPHCVYYGDTMLSIVTSPPEGALCIVFTRYVCLSLCVCVCVWVCVCVCVRPIFWYFISRLLEELSI